MSTAPPETTLETALRLATSDAAARPAFYRALLDAKLIVIGRAEVDANGFLVPGTKAELQHWRGPDGNPVLPVFSSRAALQRGIDEEVTYLAIDARALFEMTRGAALVLNPRNDYAKELTPSEIASLLDHGSANAPTPRTVTAPTQVLLGQPADHPHAMIAAVSRYAKSREEVAAIGLALMHDTSVDAKPHLVVGVTLDGAVDRAAEQRLMQEIGLVASEAARDRAEPVDLVRVVPGEDGLSAHFSAEVRPFYKRGLLAGVRRKLAFG